MKPFKIFFQCRWADSCRIVPRTHAFTTDNHKWETNSQYQIKKLSAITGLILFKFEMFILKS